MALNPLIAAGIQPIGRDVPDILMAQRRQQIAQQEINQRGAQDAALRQRWEQMAAAQQAEAEQAQQAENERKNAFQRHMIFRKGGPDALALAQQLAPGATDQDIESIMEGHAVQFGINDPFLVARQNERKAREKALFEHGLSIQRIGMQGAETRRNADYAASLRGQGGEPSFEQRLYEAQALEQAKVAGRNAAEHDAAEPKRQMRAEIAIRNADNVLRLIGNSKELIGPTTTGYAGAALRYLPESDARRLRNKVAAVKANIGFDRLQQMRDASPTGGALGQVAIQELDALQNSIDALDQLQTADELEQGLDVVANHYTNWRNATMGSVGRKPPDAPAATSRPPLDSFWKP